jgi:hypothetical protein
MSARAEGSPQGRSRAIRHEADEWVPVLRSDCGGRPMSVLRPAIKEANR